MDGGTTWNVNIASAINGCLEVVDDESKITVDILICNNSEMQTETDTNSTVSNLLRRRQIH